MLKNPTPAQLEDIRRDGVTGNYVAMWCYHATKEPQIFLLERGEAAPKGWSLTPIEPKADAE